MCSCARVCVFVGRGGGRCVPVRACLFNSKKKENAEIVQSCFVIQVSNNAFQMPIPASYPQTILTDNHNIEGSELIRKPPRLGHNRNEIEQLVKLPDKIETPSNVILTLIGPRRSRGPVMLCTHSPLPASHVVCFHVRQKRPGDSVCVRACGGEEKSRLLRGRLKVGVLPPPRGLSEPPNI